MKIELELAENEWEELLELVREHGTGVGNSMAVVFSRLSIAMEAKGLDIFNWRKATSLCLKEDISK